MSSRSFKPDRHACSSTAPWCSTASPIQRREARSSSAREARRSPRWSTSRPADPTRWSSSTAPVAPRDYTHCGSGAVPARRLISFATPFPMRIEDNPSYGAFPGENSTHRYGGGLLVGYRWYDGRGVPPRFAFGHGLSYTSFSIGPPRLSSTVFVPGEPLSVAVGVTNTGRRAGAEVVQSYVAPAGAPLIRPG